MEIWKRNVLIVVLMAVLEAVLARGIGLVTVWWVPRGAWFVVMEHPMLLSIIMASPAGMLAGMAASPWCTKGLARFALPAGILSWVLMVPLGWAGIDAFGITRQGALVPIPFTHALKYTFVPFLWNVFCACAATTAGIWIGRRLWTNWKRAHSDAATKTDWIGDN